MNTEIITRNSIDVASVTSKESVITDVQSALDIMMSVKYETGCENIAINKEAFSSDLFILSTGLAGEILEKFVTYGIRIAIYGDFSVYTSKPLHDFIYESNCGNAVFFQPGLEKAVDKLCMVKTVTKEK